MFKIINKIEFEKIKKEFRKSKKITNFYSDLTPTIKKKIVISTFLIFVLCVFLLIEEDVFIMLLAALFSSLIHAFYIVSKNTNNSTIKYCESFKTLFKEELSLNGFKEISETQSALDSYSFFESALEKTNPYDDFIYNGIYNNKNIKISAVVENLRRSDKYNSRRHTLLFIINDIDRLNFFINKNSSKRLSLFNFLVATNYKKYKDLNGCSIYTETGEFENDMLLSNLVDKIQDFPDFVGLEVKNRKMLIEISLKKEFGPKVSGNINKDNTLEYYSYLFDKVICILKIFD